LPQVESQSIFCISGLVKTLFQQRLYSFLRGGSHDRCKAGIPPGCDLDVGGKLAAFTRRLVLAIAHLSNEAIRVASASTKLSSSASGIDRFT